MKTKSNNKKVDKENEINIETQNKGMEKQNKQTKTWPEN